MKVANHPEIRRSRCRSSAAPYAGLSSKNAAGQDHSTAPSRKGQEALHSVADIPVFSQREQTDGPLLVPPALQAVSGAPLLQPKLKLGLPGDRFEKEAEAMEEAVLGRLRSGKASPPPVHPIQGGVPGIRGQAKGSGLTQDAVRPPFGGGAHGEDGVFLPGGGGRPLGRQEKREMEYGFGTSFREVRIHTGPDAIQRNERLNARAFTVGKDIYFNRQGYDPKSESGKRLLIHELTHTLQQRNKPAAIQRQGDPRHARGHAGEQSVAFSHYRREQGWLFIRGPSGAGGHGVTTGGEDGLAYNVRTKELHILDNKSLARRGNVGSATAIDAARNLQQNLDSMIRHVKSQSLRQLPYRQQILKRLRQTRAAIRRGQRLPARTQLIITNAGGRSTGVTRRLARLGITFRDVNVTPTARPGTKVPQMTGGPGAGRPAKPAVPTGVKDISIHSGKHKFKISVSMRFPRTMAVLRISGAILFDLVLSAVGSLIREHLKKKAAGKLLKKVLDDQKVQQAIEQGLAKYDHLRSKGQTPYYLSINLYEVWLGSYDRKGNAVSGLEAPAKFTFDSIGGVTSSSKRTCTLRGFKSQANYPEGVNWKHQVCSYPLMINQEAVDKVKLQKHLQAKRKAWESCVNLKNYRPGGLPTPQEAERAKVECAKEVGFSLAELSK